jgi:hypothetical protein
MPNVTDICANPQRLEAALILLMLAVIYGIGLFDALLSPLIHAINAKERRRFMLMHALKFTGYQLVIIPGGLAVLVGIAAAVCSGFF